MYHHGPLFLLMFKKRNGILNVLFNGPRIFADRSWLIKSPLVLITGMAISIKPKQNQRPRYTTLVYTLCALILLSQLHSM